MKMVWNIGADMFLIQKAQQKNSDMCRKYIDHRKGNGFIILKGDS